MSEREALTDSERAAAEAMAEAIFNHDWGIAEPGELRAALDRWQELHPDPTPR